jgi:hypothetical protein
MKEIDGRLTTYADENGLAFTRYSDDIVLSSTGDFSREQAGAACDSSWRSEDRARAAR